MVELNEVQNLAIDRNIIDDKWRNSILFYAEKAKKALDDLDSMIVEISEKQGFQGDHYYRLALGDSCDKLEFLINDLKTEEKEVHNGKVYARCGKIPECTHKYPSDNRSGLTTDGKCIFCGMYPFSVLHVLVPVEKKIEN